MIRTQIQLEQHQYDRLKALAARQSKSVSQVIRESVDELLDGERCDDAWERLIDAAGSCHAVEAATDVSLEHDAYLIGAYGQE